MTADHDAHVKSRPLRRREHRFDLGHGLVDRAGQGRARLGRALARQRPRRIGDRYRHPVPRDLQVTGPLRLDHAAQDPVDRLGSRRGVVEDRRVDGHLAVDLQLALERLDDVVEVQLRPSQRDLGTTADDQERRLLRIGTGDGIERIERAWTVRHQRHAQPAEPRVGVGGEADARLVGTDDRRHPDLLLHGVDRQTRSRPGCRTCAPRPAPAADERDTRSDS